MFPHLEDEQLPFSQCILQILKTLLVSPFNSLCAVMLKVLWLLGSLLEPFSRSINRKKVGGTTSGDRGG
jgi:hypothetical protein